MALPCRVLAIIGFGLSLDVFPVQELEGIAQLKSKLAYGRAEPWLTTIVGKAELIKLGLTTAVRLCRKCSLMSTVQPFTTKIPSTKHRYALEQINDKSTRSAHILDWYVSMTGTA